MFTFTAMNTEVALATPMLPPPSEEALAREVATVFADAERRYSRFRHGSELSQLNRTTAPLRVSPELMATLVAARRHVAETGGLFDPAIGGALAAAGYDRSFAPGALDRSTRRPAPPPARFLDVAFDEQRCTVTRPADVQIDLGGLVKGRTVDRAAALLPGPAFLDAGGDAVLIGDGPDGAGWPVDIEDPSAPDRIVLTLRVRERALATSAPNRRRWRAGDAIHHHLIDPRTHRPSTSDLAQVTVVAPTAEQADVLAKVTFLLGRSAGARFLANRAQAGGVLIAHDGTLQLVGDLEVDHAS